MRIGINVPDDLLDKVKQAWTSVNVSEVCRDALQRVVEEGRNVANRVNRDEVDEKIAWLDAQTAPPEEPDWVALALDDAATWFQRVTPAGWEQFLHQCDVLRRQGRDEVEMVDVWSSMYDTKGIRIHLHDNKEWLMSEYEREEVTGVRSHAREQATRPILARGLAMCMRYAVGWSSAAKRPMHTSRPNARRTIALVGSRNRRSNCSSNRKGGRSV